MITTQVKERPILFSGAMVRAILDGKKTQTRRIVKSTAWTSSCNGFIEYSCPYGERGEHLWVRETWRTYKSIDDCKPSGIRAGAGIEYKAGGSNVPSYENKSLLGMGKWRPSIFMLRWASRITLEITSVRMEGLNNISHEDAEAEGIRQWTKDDKLEKYWPCDPLEGSLKCSWQDLPRSPVEAYKHLWNSINGPDSWQSNPWVWVITFRRIK